MQGELLPLFPLRVVLFPRTPLPLHIFEERYRAMIGASMREESEFGIVLATHEGIVNMGCTAVVDQLLKHYKDGRLDILTMGRRRFEIESLDMEEVFLRAEVRYFDDDDDAETVPNGLLDEVVDQYMALREFGGYPAPKMTERQLSFQLAQWLPDMNFRQVLLGMRSETERLRSLAGFLPNFLSRQKTIAQVKKVARRNGNAFR